MTERPGFALAAAMAALILIAVMVTGILFAAGQESKATRHELHDQQALAYAELSAARAIASMNAAAFAGVNAGDAFSYTPARDGPLESTVFITKLDTMLVRVVAEGRIVSADASQLRRRVEIVVHFTRDSSGSERAVRISGNAWSALY